MSRSHWRSRGACAALLVLGTVRPSAANTGDPAESQWGQWRGPLATGTAPLAEPPVAWSATQNVRWRTEIPGLGHSSPVVWGDSIYLTTAIAYGERLEPKPDPDPGAHDNVPVLQRHRFEVLAVRRSDGAILWELPVADLVPHEGGHHSGSQASASPITDGERVYASFGSRGLYCCSKDGELLWSRDFGTMATKHNHGEGSSPVLFGDTLVLPWDHEGPSFVVALDARTGETRWRVERDEPTSWSTPIVVVVSGRPQVILNGTNRVRAHDLADGTLLWECGGLSSNVTASPVSAHGIVVCGSSYEKQAAFAIRLEGARGDLSAGDDHLLWALRRGTPYVPSLLLVDHSVYMLQHYQGVLRQVRLETGEDVHPPLRLPGIQNVYSSPVSAAGRVYITSQDGTTLVLRHGDRPSVLAENHLGEAVDASLALVDRELLIRGHEHLFSIASTKETDR